MAPMRLRMTDCSSVSNSLRSSAVGSPSVASQLIRPVRSISHAPWAPLLNKTLPAHQGVGRRYFIHSYLGFSQQGGRGRHCSGKLSGLLGFGFRLRLSDADIQILKKESCIHERQLDVQVLMQPFLDGV